MSIKNSITQSVQAPPQSRPMTSLPAQPPQIPWCGHHRVTRVALARILDRAGLCNGKLTLEEWALTTVCEFRRATANAEFLDRLRTNCISELAAMRFALNEIGAMNIAAYLSETMTACLRSNSVLHRRSLLEKLERNLNAAGPTLDALIAKFARGLLEAARQHRMDLRERGSGEPTASGVRWIR